LHYLNEDVKISGKVTLSYETVDGWWKKSINIRIYDVSLKTGSNFWVRKYQNVFLGEPRTDEFYYSEKLPSDETFHICVPESQLK